MSRISTVTDPKPDFPTDLTPAQIKAWLDAHPDQIESLLPSAPKTGRKVADFQSYLIERLKADKTHAINTVQEVVETARYNMNNQTRIHRAVLRLLEASTFEQFIETLTDDLTAMLDTDITTLVVESEGGHIPHIITNGIRLVPEGTIDHWMEGRAILHQSDIGGVEAIYGAGASLVRSQVLLRISIGTGAPSAVLAFGSRNPDQFHPGQGTEQITFLAQVVELLFRSWLHRND